jgi:hypothetical protein
MTRQYLRAATLIVSTIGGDGLDLSELRISFKVNQADIQTPNSAQIRVWNLSRATSQRIEKEFTRVTLQAGYGDNEAVIFDGTIVQLRRGRANATDTYLDITAADGDEAYNYAIINSSLLAGSKPEDMYKAAVEAFKKYGVTDGYIPSQGLGGQELPGGKVVFGPAKDWMRQLADNTNTTWSIQDGKVNVVTYGGYLPGEAVVLNSQSGMIGIPEQTVGGINVRSLLNPRLKYSGRVRINEGDINRAEVSLVSTGVTQYLPRLVEDGFYRIVVANHVGDTRGQDWYSDLICVALDDTAPPAQIQRGLG